MPQNGYILNNSSTWSNPAHWSSGIIADGAGYYAYINEQVNSNKTTTVDIPVIIGHFQRLGRTGDPFDFVRTFTSSGSGSITLSAPGTTPSVSSKYPIVFNCPVYGTEGINKIGGDYVQVLQPGTITGTCTVSAGIIYIGNGGSSSFWNSLTNVVVASGTDYRFNGGGGDTHTCPVNFSGAGTVSTVKNTNVTFSGDLKSLSNFRLYYSGLTALPPMSVTFANPNSLPSYIFTLTDNGNASGSNTIIYSGTSDGTTGTIGYSRVGGSTNVTLAFEVRNSSPTGAIFSITGSHVGSAEYNLNYNSSSGPILVSGVIGTIASLTKSGGGRLTLSGTNTYTTGTTISAGSLLATNASALGASSGAVSLTGGTLELSGGINLNKGGASFTTVSTSAQNAFQVPEGGGANTISCVGMALASTAIIDTASGTSLALNNTGAISGVNHGITKNNSGVLDLKSGPNTFTGAVTVNGGTLIVGSSCTPSVAGPLGSSTSTVSLNGTLKYNGATSGTISRTIGLNSASPVIDVAGSGALQVTTLSHVSASAKTLSLKGTNSLGENILSSNLGDSTGATSLAKEGSCTWKLTGGTVNYSGTTTISEGTLHFGGVQRTLSSNISISAGRIENDAASISANISISGGEVASNFSSSTIAISAGEILSNIASSDISMTGGLITGQISGESNVDIVEGTCTIYPANGSSYTGSTVVSQGAVLNLKTDSAPGVAGQGKVLGNSNVSILGEVKTYWSETQKGGTRYGGNLSFGLNSKIHIGGI
jgi:fibronectin-binding autotransporter adhesin